MVAPVSNDCPSRDVVAARARVFDGFRFLGGRRRSRPRLPSVYPEASYASSGRQALLPRRSRFRQPRRLLQVRERGVIVRNIYHATFSLRLHMMDDVGVYACCWCRLRSEKVELFLGMFLFCHATRCGVYITDGAFDVYAFCCCGLRRVFAWYNYCCNGCGSILQ